MIPSFKNAMKYSYTSFSFKELRYIKYTNIPDEELMEYDTIDITNKSVDDTDKYFHDNFNGYSKDTLNIQNGNISHYKFYFLKEFTLIENYHERNKDINHDIRIEDFLEEKPVKIIWKFDISDWDETYKRKGIDNRVIKITMYYMYADNSIKPYMSYLVKLDHIYQLILDLDSLVDEIERKQINNSEDINLYVLPVYLVQLFGDTRLFHITYYTRISSLLKNVSNNLIFDDLYYMLHGLIRFAILNYKMLLATENKNKKLKELSKIREENNTKEIKDTSVRTRIKVPLEDEDREAKQNNYVSVYLDEDVKIDINKLRSNVYYSRRDDILINMVQYRTQVHGHWHHYWCGKGENKTLEVRWIEPYIRNVGLSKVSKKEIVL